MDTKKFVAVSVYLTPEELEQVMSFAYAWNQTKSGACQLLIRKGLGTVGDVELEEMCKRGRRNGQQEEKHEG